MRKFEEYNMLAEVYVAFDKVADYIEQPFQKLSGDQNSKLEVFNVCKFLIGHL